MFSQSHMKLIIILHLVTCSCPTPPSNGYTTSCSGTAYNGNYIYYYCNSGYSRIGSYYRRRCQLGGSWSASAPLCLRSEIIGFVIQIDTFQYRDMRKISCNIKHGNIMQLFPFKKMPAPALLLQVMDTQQAVIGQIQLVLMCTTTVTVDIS